MKVRTRLTFGFILMSLLIWTTAFLASNTYRQIHNKFKLLEEDIIPGAIAMSDMSGAATQIAHKIMDYIITGDAEAKADVYLATDLLVDSLTSHAEHETGIGYQEGEASEKLLKEGNELISVAEEIINLKDQGVSIDNLLRKEEGEFHAALNTFLEYVARYRVEHFEELAEVEEAVHKAHFSGVQSLFIATGFTTLLAAAVAFFASRSIVNPIHALHRGTEIIGQGNLDYKVGTNAKDEIGQLSRAFDQMTENLTKNIYEISNLREEISRRKQAEEALRESEQRFDLAVSGSSDGFWDRKIIDDTEWWSPRYYELLGYEDGEIESIYKKFTELLHPEDRDRVVEAEQAHLEKHVPFDIQYRLLTKSGEYRCFRVRAQAIWDGNDNPIRIAGSIQDITERVRIENDLKQSEERFRELIEKAGIGISIDDVEGNLVYVNQTFADIHGYPIEEIHEQPIQSLTHPDDVERVLGYHVARIQGQEAPSRYEFLGLRKDGSVMHLESDVVRLEEDGRTTGTRTYLWDISERVRAEEQLSSYAAKLEQANQEVKQFAYIVSHDLRAPLVNLKGFATELRAALAVIGSAVITALPRLDEKLRKDVVTALQEDVPEALGFIDSSVTQMDHFINALLRLSRLGRRKLDFEQVDMNALVQAALETLAHTIEERRVKVTVGSLPEVIADQTSMEQIMGNILSNAVKYIETDRPGEIEVTAEHGDDETIFSIHDNGRGIAEEDMPKVFAPFRRIGRQDQLGEGMGLPYVQTMVRRHGGRVWCESELGLGTTFTFTISNHLAKGVDDAYDA